MDHRDHATPADATETDAGDSETWDPDDARGLPTPPGEDPLDRLAAGPEYTRVEDRELKSIEPAAHETFAKTIRRRWYAQIALGTFFALSLEYALWQLFGWYALLLALLVFPYIHRKKWERQTDYGALAAAKLAESSPGMQDHNRDE